MFLRDRQILAALFAFGLGAFISGFAQPTLQVVSPSINAASISWEDPSSTFELESSVAIGTSAAWQIVAAVPVVQGARRSVQVSVDGNTRFFRLRSADSLTTISEISPLLAEEGVAVTRETILSFSHPLAPGTVLGGSHLYAEFGGRRVLGRVELSSARDKVTLFYQENLPPSAEVKVFFEGDGLSDFNGRLIDADGDGLAGGTFATFFTTLGNTALDNTGVIGHVYTAEKGGNGANIPIAGVTITVDGAEESLRVVSDNQGAFRLQPAPVGRFFVHIDGRTVTNLAAGIRYPDRAYYPFVGKAWTAVAGYSNNLAGGTGEIFLPLIQADALKAVSSSSDTTIGVSSSVLATNSAFANVTITVPANSLFADNGTRGGKVGIAPVPSDRLPGPLPPGLNLPLVITVQTDGPLNFDEPAPICFPNLPDPVLGVPLAPGTKQALISFNHDKGEWEAVGTMTVSADGKLICSDPGSGIRQPGWHGSGPQPSGPPPPAPPQPPPPPPPAPDPPPDPPKPNPCENGKDPECYCQDPAPNPDELKRCYDEVEKEMEAPCRKAAQISYNERVKFCLRNYQDGNTTFPDYQECLKEVKSKLQAELRQCNKDANEKRAWCNKCNGAPAPAPARLSALEAATIDPAGAIIAKHDELNALIDLVPPLPEAEFVGRIEALLAEVDALANGNVRNALSSSAAADQRAAKLQPLIPSFVLGNAPAHPIKYAAHVIRPSGEMFIRGDTLPFAQYSIFVPRDGFLMRVMFYDPVSRRYGEVQPDRRPEAPYLLPRLFLAPNDPSNYPDTDGDGLSDLVELVYGSNPLDADSDGDGLRDGIEVAQGSNPLDGAPAQIGIVGSVKTQGIAVDICAFGDFAALAEGAAGVSIFNVADPSNPVRVVQIDTAGQANAVAFSAGSLAVADGDRGLAIIDVAKPANATLRSQVVLPAAAASVAAAGGIAYVGTSDGRVSAVDLATGALLQTVSLGNQRIDDLLVDGNALYVYSRLNLSSVSLDQNVMTPTGKSITVPGVLGAGSIRYRLTGGSDLLYAANGRGFAVLEWTDIATTPKLIANNATTQVGWKQIVPNSGGIGVAAVGLNSTTDGAHDIYLHDLRPGGTNSLFLSIIGTPGYAGAVALQGRLAYVADGAAGLQVINYLPADLAGVAPTITLSADFSVSPPGIESGKHGRLTANAFDDILVAAVEFYIDGQLVRRDESYPFNYDFYAPGLTAQKTSFTVRARAVDTAGNATATGLLTVALLPDATPPSVVRIFPTSGAVLEAAQRVTVRFSEAMNPGSFTQEALHLLSAGSDFLFGTADDSIIPMRPTYLSDVASAQFDFPAGLPNGAYRVEIGSVTDAAGLVLPGPVTADFFVAPGGPEGDPDVDGLSNIEESTGRSNPFIADTDGDGWVDELEVHGGTNPRDPASYPEWRVIAMPNVSVIVIDSAEVLPAVLSPILAQPQVDLIAIDSQERALVGPWVSQPSIDIGIVSADETVLAGPWMADPQVEVLLRDNLESAPAGPHIARPPVTVKLNP